MVLLTLFFFSLMMGTAEWVVRQETVQSLLGPPGLNGIHEQFEIQWNRLDTLAKAGYKVDCIALGNSMVLNAFNPDAFARSYHDRSGEEIHCFNFGVDALTPVSANALAEILIQAYHPRLLIIGTDARDFAIATGSEETSVINDMAWVQYRLGRFNLDGWLVEHSYLYRYKQKIASLFHFSLRIRTDQPINRFGFEPMDTVFAIDVPPDPDDESYHVQYYYRILNQFSIEPDNIIAFEQILDRENPSMAIVVMEMPVPQSYFMFFDQPNADYRSFIDVLRQKTAAHQVWLVETTRHDLIPDDGWMDYSHVNTKGAEIFSDWLGSHLGQAVNSGRLVIPPP